MWVHVVDNKLYTKSLPVVKEDVAVDSTQEVTVTNDYTEEVTVTNDSTQEVTVTNDYTEEV